MDPGFVLNHENPIQNAGWLSRVLFLWPMDLFRKIKHKALEMTDLFKTLDGDNSKNLGNILEKNWNEELVISKQTGKKASLLKVVLKTFGYRFFLWGIVMFVQISCRIIQPTVLAYFITMFERKNQGNVQMEMVLYGTLIILMAFFIVVTHHHSHFNFYLIGMRCRVAISSLVYRKATRLKLASLSKVSTGDIVNLLSNDVSRFDVGMQNLNILWMLPLFIVLIPYLLWNQVEWSFLAGFCPLLILSVPLQSFLAKVTRKLRLGIAKKTDRRVSLMTEILSGIQVIKMYTWEKTFETFINEARDSELKDVKTSSYVRGIFQSCALNLKIVAVFFTFMTYVLTKHTFTATTVFVVIQYLSVLQIVFCVHLFRSLTYGAEHLAALQRLGDFLNLEEKESHMLENGKDAGVYFNNVSAAWTTSTLTLRDINLHIPPGILCVIVGQVGAGKSSLIQVILGELPVSTGKISLGDEISFASQEPWVFSSTVRNNILFGQPYDKSWYDEIIQICSLEKDLVDLPHGDQTLVGDRGVSLSGGQKARINLARSVYRKASIYIMDDPLSAVDTQVGKFLFEECICKHLNGKTRVLVTHQLQFIKKADHIVVMNEGHIEAQGTYQDLINSNLSSSKFLPLSEENEEKGDERIIEDEIEVTEHTSSSICSRKESVKKILLNPEKENGIIREMEKSISDPKVFALKEYFQATKNVCLLSTLVALLIGGEVLTTFAEYWVAFWTDQEETRNWNYTRITEQTGNYSIMDNYFFDEISTENGIVTLLKTDLALIIYGLIVILAMIATFFKAMVFFKVAVLSSKNLHAAMFQSVLLAPMKFFNSNPCGRILNRFSKDLGAVDELLPRMLLDAIQFTFPLFGCLVNISASNPYNIGLIIVCSVIFRFLVKLTLPAIKCIKHLEGVAKSPVFSFVSSTLNGLPTIRSTNSGSMLIDEFDKHQNTHTSAYYLVLATISAFTIWVDFLCVLFLACITYSFIILNMFFPVNGSLVGLGITQVLSLFGILQFGLNQTTEVINQLTNVERVLQYSKIETEGPFETPEENIPKEMWPSKGGIEFRSLSIRYDEDDPPVLKDLNFTIIPEEKIGIVGRTGAGKSSLISALFRLVNLEGSIVIDGVDTKSLGLTYLRNHISIIPQDPVLFSATLRCNLDPFDEFDDEEIWRVLVDVELSDLVTSLDFVVCQGGSNFSLGQRQLICLARAMLRKNKILILDEATANVDMKTDAIIQTVIRRNFKHCTVLTIAHRLNTIMDSNRVLVMSSGRIVEFDHPYRLLQDEYGYFSKMVARTGPSMSQQLTNIARETFRTQATSW